MADGFFSYSLRILELYGCAERVLFPTGRCASAGQIPFAALGPDESETSQGLQDKFPKTDAFGYVALADGRLRLLPEGVSCFAGDLTEEDSRVGHSYSACRGFVRSASAGHRVAVQAELVHRGQ